MLVVFLETSIQMHLSRKISPTRHRTLFGETSSGPASLAQRCSR